MITDAPGVMLAVGTADCVPVLVMDVEKRVVRAFHAGWRGRTAGYGEGSCDDVEEVRVAGGGFEGGCGAEYWGLLLFGGGGEVRAKFGQGFDYAEEFFLGGR